MKAPTRESVGPIGNWPCLVLLRTFMIWFTMDSFPWFLAKVSSSVPSQALLSISGFIRIRGENCLSHSPDWLPWEETEYLSRTFVCLLWSCSKQKWPPQWGEIMRNIFHLPLLSCFEKKNEKCQRKLYLELQRWEEWSPRPPHDLIFKPWRTGGYRSHDLSASPQIKNKPVFPAASAQTVPSFSTAFSLSFCPLPSLRTQCVL